MWPAWQQRVEQRNHALGVARKPLPCRPMQDTAIHPPPLCWDLFCQVIDNFGDIGVCWRLAVNLAARGQQVRLWVDDASALAWMAPTGALGVEEAADAEKTWDMVAAALEEMPAHATEELVSDQGGIAVRVRTMDEWRNSEQGRAVKNEDLFGQRVVSGAAARTPPDALTPFGGIRVLDLTRVIAGPVCTRYLAALGADVLRLDGPSHLDMAPGEPSDTLLGKRSAELDFALPGGHHTLHHLLDSADVLVCGYRPGSLDRFGLTDEELIERHPGLVVLRLAAWGHTGPWAMRRGFDSIVQAATGIAHAEGVAGRPGALPCQLLDHGTGYLAAAAVLDGVRQQQTVGGTHIRTLSLARTATLLIDSYDPHASKVVPSSSQDPVLTRLGSVRGEVAAVAPPGSIGDQRLQWSPRVTGYLDDEPVWRKR